MALIMSTKKFCETRDPVVSVKVNQEYRAMEK